LKPKTELIQLPEALGRWHLLSALILLLLSYWIRINLFYSLVYFYWALLLLDFFLPRVLKGADFSLEGLRPMHEGEHLRLQLTVQWRWFRLRWPITGYQVSLNQRVSGLLLERHQGDLRVQGKRGVWAWSFKELTSHWPFGFFHYRIALTQHLSDLLVYPALIPYPIPEARTIEGAQEWAMDDVQYFRTYQEGDPVRWLHWKKSAQVGQAIVGVPGKEPIQEAQWQWFFPDDCPCFEQALSAIAHDVVVHQRPWRILSTGVQGESLPNTAQTLLLLAQVQPLPEDWLWQDAPPVSLVKASDFCPAR
jgi:hypothetical protein